MIIASHVFPRGGRQQSGRDVVADNEWKLNRSTSSNVISSDAFLLAQAPATAARCGGRLDVGRASRLALGPEASLLARSRCGGLTAVPSRAL